MARDKLFKRSLLQAKKGVNVGYQIAVKKIFRNYENSSKKISKTIIKKHF